MMDSRGGRELMASKSIIYIGDFDLRNKNVQAHLVVNNGKIFNSLGYKVYFIGVNRNLTEFDDVNVLDPVILGKNEYYEVPNTLNIQGLKKVGAVCNSIIDFMNKAMDETDVKYVVTYQSPTYSLLIDKVVKWARNNSIPYIVNSADLPIFKQQSLVRRIVMSYNWKHLHNVNKKYAKGVIAVSTYIKDFYANKNSIVIPPLFEFSNEQVQIEGNEIVTFIYAGTPFALNGRVVAPSCMKDRLDKIIDLCIELSKRRKAYRLLVVGISKDDYLIGVPRHRQDLEDESKVIFLGKRGHGETLDLISKADFSINYRDENLMTKAGFSTKVVESISLGTPVITNPISDLELYLEKDVSWIDIGGCIMKDADKIAGVCEWNKEKRIKMKNNLRNERVFDINRFQGKMKVFLERVGS